MARRSDGLDMYTAFARCYDLVMRDVDYEGWAEYVLGLCERFALDPSPLLNLACGTGSLEVVLSDRVRRIVCSDISASMADVARVKFETAGLEFPVHVGRMQDFQGGETFALALCLYDSLNYVTKPEEVRQTFQNVHRQLTPGGGFIFDITTEYNIVRNFAQYTFAETFDDLAYIWENQYDIESKLAVSEFTFFERDDDGRYTRHFERHVQRMYSVAFLRDLLRDEGFEFLAAFEGFTHRPPGRTAERIHLIARRPA